LNLHVAAPPAPPPEPPGMAETGIEIAGTSAVLDPAGALWLPESRTLIVADLHLEKGSAFARQGMFLPPYDTHATLALLARLVARREPRAVVCLGDSFHDRGGFGRLGDSDRRTLAHLQRGRSWVWVTGNHDRELPADTGGDIVAQFACQGLTFRHEPTPAPADGEVAGHLHPSAKVRSRGRSVRCRAFATDGVRMVLPAFGVLTGGLNVLDRAFAPLFPAAVLRAVLIGGGRLFPVSYSALCPD
jgi:DNA ligase-associated metallophosphoesterase